MDDPQSVTVRAAGGLSDELPAFTVQSPMPGSLGLRYTDDDLASLRGPSGGPDGGALVIRWNTNGDDDAALGLRLTPLLGDEPMGDDIICLVADRGQTRLDLSELHTLGFATDAEAVRIEASRSQTSLFDVGAWTGIELVVERRDATQLPLR